MTKAWGAIALVSSLLVCTAHAHTNPPDIRSRGRSIIDLCSKYLTTNSKPEVKPIVAEATTPSTVSISEKLYYQTSVGPQPYRVFKPAGRAESTTVFLNIHGMAGDLDTNSAFLREVASHGHEMVSVGLDGSDLDLLKQEKEVRKTDRFANSVQAITEFALAYYGGRSHAQRVVIVGHSMGAAVGLIVAKNLRERGINVAMVYGGGFINYQVALTNAMGKTAVLAAIARKRLASLFGPFEIFANNWLKQRFKAVRESEGLEIRDADIDLLARGSLGFLMKDMAEIEKTAEGTSVVMKYDILANEKNASYADTFGTLSAKQIFAREQVPVLVLAGKNDAIAPADELKHVAEDLAAHHIPVEYKLLEGEGSDHEFLGKRSKDSYAAIRSFVSQQDKGDQEQLWERIQHSQHLGH